MNSISSMKTFFFIFDKMLVVGFNVILVVFIIIVVFEIFKEITNLFSVKFQMSTTEGFSPTLKTEWKNASF